MLPKFLTAPNAQREASIDALRSLDDAVLNDLGLPRWKLDALDYASRAKRWRWFTRQEKRAA